MNNSTRLVTLLTLATVFACGGPEDQLAIDEANAAPDPFQPSRRLFVDCTPVFEYIASGAAANGQLAAVNIDYAGASGSASAYFIGGFDPEDVTDSLSFTGVSMEGNLLADTLDVEFSGIQPTRGNFSLNRAPRITTNRNGVPTYIPGIIGPSAANPVVSYCAVERRAYGQAAVVRIPSTSEQGTLTIDIQWFYVGG